MTLDVCGMPVRAKEHGIGTKWWTISESAARKLVRRVGRTSLPRPGYEANVGEGMRPSGAYDRPGTWWLVNRGGDYELMFYYR